MLKALAQFFQSSILEPVDNAPGVDAHERKLQIATAALMIEASRVDYDVSEQESEVINEKLRAHLGLSEDDTSRLVELAASELDDATSMHGFTRLANEHFSYEEKVHIVELLWEVTFADGVVHKYEEHLVRKIADLLYVSHGDFIRSKHRVASRHGQ